MRKFRLVAPAGAPLSLWAVLVSGLGLRGHQSCVTEYLQRLLGLRHIFVVCSGRAALTVVLKAAKERSTRREVVIPAYTCFSVPSAVVRAGLQIRLCDVDPKTLDLDQNALLQLDLGKVLCIVPSGLYGLPPDLAALERVSRACGAFLIDDAAQCLGATTGGKPCGTWGDAGFYSLGRGKNITTMGGGIIVTHREDLAALIEHSVASLHHASTCETYSAVLSSLVYAAMLRPSRYWVLDRIPFLELGVSRFDPAFAMSKFSAYQAGLASQVLPLVDGYSRIRRDNAERLLSGIEGAEGIETPRPHPGSNPVYLRFPILARDGVHRSRLLEQLRHAGIGASISYPTSIADIPGIQGYLAHDQQPCPQARSIAERIVTLPTHPHVTPAHIEEMITICRKYACY
jgi:dTDP-4-amino-4,6-dideoxygalactose transaminase